MENVIYKPDHAVVTVSGVINEPMMLQLVNTLQRLHHDYYYQSIGLDISSPGGEVLALDYCMEVMEQLRESGVRFTTRALLSVSSAAAYLVALGDRRKASRTAMLLYHGSRQPRADTVTARLAGQLQGELERIDDRYLSLLVKRVLHNSAPSTRLTTDGFIDTDWPIAHRLLAGVGAIQTQPDGVKPTPEEQLEQLREHISLCLKEEKDLKELYKQLFELDRQISASLARELLLVDDFVSADGEPGSRMPAEPPQDAGVPGTERRVAYSAVGAANAVWRCSHS